MAKVDPVKYLADVLPRLATRRIHLCDMPALLPAFETLAGFVAGDANHGRASRRQDLLYEIAEATQR